MKILAFGGSFDPPHAGHSALLAAAARAVDPDVILVVPAWRNPLKTRTPASAADRLEMVRLGVLDAVPGQWRRRTWIYLGELISGRPVYTVDTLTVLAREFPDAELHFAVGWDAAAQFSSWRQPARLKSLARWWTARRPGASGEAPSLFRRLSAPMPAVSSTELRAKLLLGEEPGRSVAASVRAYIEKRGLYGLDRLGALRGMLSADRYEHSRSVARLAGALARRWSLDEETALIAGLLHDCGRSISVPRMAAYVRKRGVRVPEREETARRRPLLLHAYISGDLCRRRFGVTDATLLSAVTKHTLGAASMGALDRLIYVADACSEDRSYPQAAALRRLAFDDLDEAYAACLRQKLSFCLAEGSWVHPETTPRMERSRKLTLLQRTLAGVLLALALGVAALENRSPVAAAVREGKPWSCWLILDAPDAALPYLFLAYYTPRGRSLDLIYVPQTTKLPDGTTLARAFAAAKRGGASDGDAAKALVAAAQPLIEASPRFFRAPITGGDEPPVAARRWLAQKTRGGAFWAVRVLREERARIGKVRAVQDRAGDSRDG